MSSTWYASGHFGFFINFSQMLKVFTFALLFKHCFSWFPFHKVNGKFLLLVHQVWSCAGLTSSKYQASTIQQLMTILDELIIQIERRLVRMTRQTWRTVLLVI